MTTSLSSVGDPGSAFDAGSTVLPGFDPALVPVPGLSGVPTGFPSEDVLRTLPAALAGTTGQSPQALIDPGQAGGAEPLLYFLQSAQPSAPGVLPALRLDQPGLDPATGAIVPSALLAADPRSLPGRTAAPGQHLGSTAPATPGIELGAQPFAGAIPPASAFGPPTEDHIRDLTAAVAGGIGIAPSAAHLPTDAGPYFLASEYPAAPRGASLVDLRPRDADLEPLPDLGLVLGAGLSIPPSIPGASAASAPLRGQEPFGTVPDVGAVPPAAGASPYFLGETWQGGLPRVDAVEPERVAGESSAHPGFDVYAIRRDFPILQEKVHGRPLIWLDNGATTQKPQAVIDRLVHFYQHENSNIHRAAHELAARATDAYEGARDIVARFLHASTKDEIVFVRGTTEGINLIAKSWGRRNIGKDDEIVITWLEHHANIVPWQQLAAETGAKLRVAPVDDRGQVILEEYEKLFNSRTKLASFTQVSNALGTITPAKTMIEIAHRHGARVLLDGAQGIAHAAVDVQALDVDWYVFSAHKIFGPTGIGAVYGKLDLLNTTPPWQGGGNMIQDVTHERTIYHAAPHRFEAGTGNIADAVGMGAALEYVERLGIENIARAEHELLGYATAGLLSVPGLRLIGTAAEKAGVLSFVLPGFRSEDVGKALNQEGIAVRAGHHCAQPILRRFGLETTVRPSLALYNTREDVDALVDAVRRIQSGGSILKR